MENVVSNELNSLLKGEYMAVDSFEKCIQHTDDQNAKNELQKLQQTHKQHSIQLAARIQQLGGKPVSGVGVTGKVAEIISDIKDINKKNTTEFLQELYTGEDKGVKMAREIVKGDLDKDSMDLVNNILNEDNSHLAIINGMISALQNKH